MFNNIINNFCEVPIINKENKNDDDLDGDGSHNIAIRDLTKEEVKTKQQNPNNKKNRNNWNRDSNCFFLIQVHSLLIFHSS